MSILNIEKTGEWLKTNQADIAILLGFLLVSLVSFGAGRLSAPQLVRNPVVIESPQSSSTANLYGGVSQAVTEAGEPAVPTSEKGLFVASKNGTKFHWPWCSWAKKIKPENEKWFNSESESKAAGFSPCACVVSQAPAGYKPQ